MYLRCRDNSRRQRLFAFELRARASITRPRDELILRPMQPQQLLLLFLFTIRATRMWNSSVNRISSRKFLDRFQERFAAFQLCLATSWTYLWGPNAMPERDDHRESAAFKLPRRANTPADRMHLFAQAESWLRPVDQLDYLIRRWAIPLPFEVSQSVASTHLFRWSLPRKHSQGVSRSKPHREASMRNSGLLSEVQAAIGRYLRAEYDLAQPIPAHLVDLLRQFEQRSGERITTASGAGRA
jgi:hypothetical protein